MPMEVSKAGTFLAASPSRRLRAHSDKEDKRLLEMREQRFLLMPEASGHSANPPICVRNLTWSLIDFSWVFRFGLGVGRRSP